MNVRYLVGVLGLASIISMGVVGTAGAKDEWFVLGEQTIKNTDPSVRITAEDAKWIKEDVKDVRLSVEGADVDINKVVAQKPGGMLLAMHLCRGNFKSTHAAAGNYEPVAEALLKEMDIDAYFMEYDDDRSGDFRPLRYLPKGKTVVLGLVTTKFGQLEDKDALKRRIEEAAKYAPMEQLALSPQCGFSSTVHGNNIAVEDQRNKLRLVVETAQDVWGTA